MKEKKQMVMLIEEGAKGSKSGKDSDVNQLAGVKNDRNKRQ